MEACYPMELRAVGKDYLWGGRRLEALYGKKVAGERLAESWELSCLPGSESVVRAGAYAGRTLPEVLGCGGDFPLLVKLIDAARDLSIQVHPSDETADAARGERGKAELWYVVESAPDACLYYGLAHALTARELEQSARDGTILRHLNRVAVKKGDAFFVAPGTIHGLGAGLVVAEVQQSSDTTFRLYDFGRLGADGQPRALHLARGCAVAERTPRPPRPCPPGARRTYGGGTLTELFSCAYFSVALLEAAREAALPPQGDTGFAHLLFLEGSGRIVYEENSAPFTPGSSWYLPAGLGGIRVEGACRALLTRG